MKLFRKREESARLAVGQEWCYRTRAVEPESTLVIGRMETASSGEIVHVSVRRVRISNPRSTTAVVDTIAHLPMDRDALLASITNRQGSGQPDAEFDDGYRQWEEAEGGAFAVSVAEAIAIVEELLMRADGRAN